MSFGLRVWNEIGQVNVDVTTRLTRFVGVIKATSSLNWKFIPVVGMTADGAWGVIVTAIHYSVRVVEGGFEFRNTQTDYPWDINFLIFRY